ncbi:MAG: ABC transporter permease [Methylocystis sp.]|nr:ABC transporter permease [Methylocystis sp.]
MKIIIEPDLSAQNYWRDIWRFRDLLYILAWRDVAVRYKQTIIGFAWAVVRPLMIVIGFVFFRRMANASEERLPEFLLVFAGALPWQFFASALSDCAGSVVGNANLISKVYFPRIIVPIASVIAGSADFVVSLALFLGLTLWHGYSPGWRFLHLPAIFLLLFSLSLGFGLIFAALNARYRDFRFIVPFIVQFGVFISPVGYGLGDVSPSWRLLYALNPMVGAIDWFRWASFGDVYPFDWRVAAISVTIAAISLAFGVSYFRRVENIFADII